MFIEYEQMIQLRGDTFVLDLLILFSKGNIC